MISLLFVKLSCHPRPLKLILYHILDIKNLSQEAMDHIAELRDHLQETLYNVVRESHPREVASTRFGNMLLFIPTIMVILHFIHNNIIILDARKRNV